MRKTPQQARSRETVARIVAAGRRVLAAHGYDAFTTNRVAAEAGVSPGSLYQYFPDKAAILDVVIEEYWDEVADRVAASLADRIGETGPAMLRGVADALLTALEADRVLLRVVAEELSVARNRTRRDALEKRVGELLLTFLRARPEATLRPDPRAASWMVVLAAEHLAMRWVLDQPPGIDRETLLGELVALTEGYLGHP